jgi:hypothetical protein
MFSNCCCRWYIDPAESVMTYHNFVTGERIFDYQMKDKKLREICIENMYGKSDSQPVLQIVPFVGVPHARPAHKSITRCCTSMNCTYLT